MKRLKPEILCDLHLVLDEPVEVDATTQFFYTEDALWEMDLCKEHMELKYEALLSVAPIHGNKTLKFAPTSPEKKPKTRKKKAPAADLKQIEADLNGIEKQLDEIAPEELPGLCEVGGCTYIVTGPQGYGLHLNRTHDIKEKSLAEKREVARSL